MGKANRNKLKRIKRVYKRPDDAISYRPIRMERFGRFIRSRNVSTPEQHLELLKKLKESHHAIESDLEREVAVLQQLVMRYDPVEVMHRAAYIVLTLFIKYRSESEYLEDEPYFLPTIEYLQYLISRSETKTDGPAPTEAEFQERWQQGVKVLMTTQSYLLTRPTLTTPPSAIDELRFVIDQRRLMVRVRRYPLFLADYLRTSLLPYAPQIKELYGVGIDEVIGELQKVDEHQKSGVIDRYREAMSLTLSLMAKLREKGHTIGPDESEEDHRRAQEALDSDEFRQLHADVQAQLGRTFTAALFDITDLTALPTALLSLLSVTPGETILTHLTGPDHDDLSPLSTSVLHYKPFLHVNGRFYSFYHSGFEDRLAEIVEDEIFRRRPGQLPAMAKKRSDLLEAEAISLLTSVVTHDFALQNVYYPNPDQPGSLAELDGLVGVDDLLFLIEVKAGGFSTAASRGAPKSVVQELQDLIGEGQRQSERAEKYIRSNPDVAFFDESGKNERCRIRLDSFRRIFRIVITKEDLGWVGARLAILSVLDPALTTSLAWHIAIDDLRAVADLFKRDEIRFANYLEQRLRAGEEPVLSQNDEIEHIALYNKMNSYHDLPVKGVDRFIFDPSYMRDIDYYFMEKSAGGNPVVPTQAIPPKIQALIRALQSSHLAGRFEAGSIVLSMSGAARREFANSLDQLEVRRRAGKQPTIRLPFSEGFGLSVTHAAGPNLNEELTRSAVQMKRARCSRWVVIQLADDAQPSVTQIERITPARYSDDELRASEEHVEREVQRLIASQKPRRNDRCPCGSGKKFKKCHGS
jgi:hypothetical protein